MTTRERESIERRLRFVAKSRSFFDVLAGKFMRAIHRDVHNSYHHMADRACHIGYDILESLRLGKAVPAFGDVCSAIDELEAPVSQLPAQRGYWYDESKHSMVGLHLGVDLVKAGDKYVVIEMNTSAAMKPARRALFKTKHDPLVTNLVETAKRLEFKNLVVLREFWEGYKTEFPAAGEEFGINVAPASYPWMEYSAKHRMHRLPDALEPDTMYVSFGGRCAAIDYYAADKLSMQRWMNDLIEHTPEFAARLAVVPTYEHLVVPPLDCDPRWPNLVVKVTGKESGKSMAILKVETEQEAMRVLRMDHPGAFPRVLKVNPIEDLRDKMFHRNRVIFQPFVPPRLNDGCGEIVRPHILVSPLESRMLAVHKYVSDHPVGVECPRGLVEDANAFIVNPSHGAHYALLDEDQREEIEGTVSVLCKMIDTGLKQKFEWRC